MGIGRCSRKDSRCRCATSTSLLYEAARDGSASRLLCAGGYATGLGRLSKHSAAARCLHRCCSPSQCCGAREARSLRKAELGRGGRGGGGRRSSNKTKIKLVPM